ncbi:Transducin/WD40 repeat-like superfamily protein [Euphorbia peplus]|nr:Transducin/WD40 repeat-like superfamily protein [Euphorbia peplus]
MGSLSEEEFRFFDANEEIASVSDAKSDVIEEFDSHSSTDNSIASSPHYELWMKTPRSVMERRSLFLDWMGEGLGRNVFDGGIDRIRETSGAVLRNPAIEDEFCSTRSTMSSWSYDNTCLPQELGPKENFICRNEDSARLMMCNDEVTLERLIIADESDNTSRSSPSFRLHLPKETEGSNNMMETAKCVKRGWLSRLRSMACALDKQTEAEKLKQAEEDALLPSKVQRVKVRLCGKQKKELSALYKGQEIQAHEGSIRTMKFSPDGQYLASAGEDRIVRLWQVLEDERSNEVDVPDIDPSCVYFTVNHLSELKPLFIDKEKAAKLRSLRKTSDSACVIFPPKVFRILEKPLHEFDGHKGEILDLSWSKENHLLSASEDKTVRLWQVGSDHCLGVFSHSNFVTCVQFNPVDKDYFMSGSIDGKVRIWAIPSCQVVDWIDIKEIVTAVCYHPDGKGGIVGSLGGTCRFYNISGSNLQLDAEICLRSKKKSSCRKITGFQFCPQDSTKVMVTCSDSQVRILQGLNVIGKYKGMKNTASQISAYFTSDGKHIISACEDSNVYMWNCVGQEEHVTIQEKKIRSFERFSTNASLAIPWGGFKRGNVENGWRFQVSNNDSPEVMPFSSPAGFSLSQEYFLESFPKGSATWPEEKLPVSKSSVMHKSQYKFLKASCQNTATSHAWGLVIVTAGWDGRIRSFHNYGLPVSV